MVIDVATCAHDYDPHGCCRRCGHLKPGGIAHQEAMENRQRCETMDKLKEMFRNAEAEFTCAQKNGGVCCFNGFCELHKQHELARYLVNHGVQINGTTGLSESMYHPNRKETLCLSVNCGKESVYDCK